jgi:hypothetical protein
VHARTDLFCDGAESAHDPALIRSDDVEARGQERRKRKKQEGQKPIAVPASAWPPKSAAALMRVRSWRFACAIPVGRDRHRNSPSDFFFGSRSASADSEPDPCGESAAPIGVLTFGAGSPDAGCASKCKSCRASASAGKNKVVLSSRILS